ncbi:MAG: serpin family protein [Anaerolineae bacterium]
MRYLWLLLILSLLVSGCTPAGSVGAQEARSGEPRETSPDVPSDDLQALVDGNTAFAVDLYRRLREADAGNLFFSPHSISVALAMTYAGVRGETAEQMAETLHFTLPQARLHAAFNALDLALQPAKDADEEAFTLNIANSLWAEETYTFRDEFLDLLARHYGAGLRLVSFKTAAEAARQTINAWVEKKTEGKIKDLIPKGGVDDLTRLVLANAIYFNAKWAYTFPEDRTQDGIFTTADGREVSVPMMSWDQPEMIPYTRGENYQALELPYRGGEASMVILVPDAGAFADVEAGLTGQRLQEIVAEMETKGVVLTMPKFEYQAEASLADTLKAMGMTDALDPDRADFSGMDGTRDLYITNVFHKAYVAVDEEGTEAAAATAVIVGLESMPMTDVEITIDRPFIYLIRDRETGAVLFLGRVVDPRG